MVPYLILLGVLIAAALAGGVAPRTTGHVLAFAFGLAALGTGVVALGSSVPSVLGVTLLVVGVMLVVLAFYSLRRSRAAWSALIATLAVLPLATLFGAPKIATLMDTSLAIALIAPGLKIIAVIALAMTSDQYRER